MKFSETGWTPRLVGRFGTLDGGSELCIRGRRATATGKWTRAAKRDVSAMTIATSPCQPDIVFEFWCLDTYLARAYFKAYISMVENVVGRGLGSKIPVTGVADENLQG